MLLVIPSFSSRWSWCSHEGTSSLALAASPFSVSPCFDSSPCPLTTRLSKLFLFIFTFPLGEMVSVNVVVNGKERLMVLSFLKNRKKSEVYLKLEPHCWASSRVAKESKTDGQSHTVLWRQWSSTHYCSMWVLLFTYFPCGILTGENVVQVPGQHRVQDRVQAHHTDGGEEGELVSLQRTRLDVIPLQTHTLLLIAWQIFCAKAKSYLWQQTLQEEVKTQ